MPDTPNRNRSVDDRKWAASTNLVRAYNEYKQAQEENPFSDKTKAALIRTELALKQFKKMQKVVS